MLFHLGFCQAFLEHKDKKLGPSEQILRAFKVLQCLCDSTKTVDRAKDWSRSHWTTRLMNLRLNEQGERYRQVESAAKGAWSGCQQLTADSQECCEL